jgi:hypothetical protein
LEAEKNGFVGQKQFIMSGDCYTSMQLQEHSRLVNSDMTELKDDILAGLNL